MKQFSCGAVVPGCTRTFSGTEEQILGAVAEHARADHGVSPFPESLAAQVRSNMVLAA